ncbi:MAG: hypothetical protein ACR2NP_12125 [Pirellulaceae bacterium]
MKKHWLTIAEVGIAVIGLVGWILSSNIYVAVAAAVLMFVFGVTKPIMDARKSRRTQQYVERQFDRAESHVASEIAELVEKLPQPDVPPRELVHAMMVQCCGSQAAEQMEIYDDFAGYIAAGQSPMDDNEATSRFMQPEILQQLKAIALYQMDDLAAAAAGFRSNTQVHPEWAAAWYGWLLCEFRQGNMQVVMDNNPQLSGIEWQPYAPGDQDCFLAMDEYDREEMITGYQVAMRGIGDLYAAASMHLGRQQIAESRDEYREAA